MWSTAALVGSRNGEYAYRSQWFRRHMRSLWNSFGETGRQVRGISQDLRIPTCILFPSDTDLLIVEWVRRRQPLQARTATLESLNPLTVASNLLWKKKSKTWASASASLIIKLEVIEALLGDDGRQLLERHAQDETTLKRTISNALDPLWSERTSEVLQ
jgi:hypothetical protein